MQDLFQSAFLQALGKAIAGSIWQMGLLFIIYYLLVFLFRIKQAVLKNFFSSVFALGGFAWFIAGIGLHWKEQLQNKTALIINDAGINNSLLNSFTKDNRWQLLFNWLDYKIHFILPYLSVAYLFVMFWFAAKLFVQLQAANSLRHKGLTVVDGEMQEFFSLLLHTMGLQRHVQLFISKQIDIPATLGFLKPIVLLPAAAVTHLTAAQLEAVLLHELAHIKRNDYFWNLMLSVSETMLFFNPFALLLIGIARRERENSCDDQVMNYQQNAAIYAEALLNVEKARIQNPQLVMALGDNKHHLMDRVKRILNIPAEKNKISTRLLALLFFTVVFALMGWMIKERKPASIKEQPLASTKISEKRINTVYFNPDAVVKKTNEAVSLQDKKQQIRLELKKQVNEEEIIVWNDAEGEEMKFDKVIFNDLPAEWIERFVKPGMRVIPLPGMRRKPGVMVRRRPDSLLIAQQQEMEMEFLFENIERDSKEKHPLQRVRVTGNPYLHFQKNWDTDSLMQKIKGQFPEGFTFNNVPAEGLLQQYFPPEEFYFQQRTNAQQAADDAKKERMKTRFTISRKIKKDTTDNARLKNRKPSSPVLAYLYNEQGLHEDFQLAQQHIQIVVENNQMFMHGNPPSCSCPDSIQGQITAPAQQKRVIRKLEVIRL